MTTFGSKLRIWRGKRYQKEAAEILKVSFRTYQNWEEGVNTPSPFAVVEIERIMEANPEPGE